MTHVSTDIADRMVMAMAEAGYPNVTWQPDPDGGVVFMYVPLYGQTKEGYLRALYKAKIICGGVHTRCLDCYLNEATDTPASQTRCTHV